MKTIYQPRAIAAASLAFTACLFAGTASAHAINGAIYTSTADHSQVNANLYENKEDVYLNGGPSNSQCNGGKLDDGYYYFQVTDPSGKTRLHRLNGGPNADPVAKRKFRVEDGVISENLTGGFRPTGGVSPCGSLSIRLYPFSDTPNNGGVYKVWITRVDDYVAGCENTVSQACGSFGFVPGHTKTDNFKVRHRKPAPTGDLEAIKFYDANANGQYDAGDILLEGWPMTLTSIKQSVDSSRSTDALGVAGFNGLVPDDDYFVEEGMPTESNWVHSATVYSGYGGGPQNPAGPLTVVADQTTTVLFGNYCRVPAASGGRTLGFWSNQNGLAQLLDGPDGLEPEFALLSGYNLRDGNAVDFDPDPADYDGFRDWLLGGNSTYMGYMLSVQMAAMILNVEAGFVNPLAYYAAAGKTVGQIITEANASLADPFEDAGIRAYREARKNWLDALNNGAEVYVPSPTPCTATFD